LMNQVSPLCASRHLLGVNFHSPEKVFFESEHIRINELADGCHKIAGGKSSVSSVSRSNVCEVWMLAQLLDVVRDAFGGHEHKLRLWMRFARHFGKLDHLAVQAEHIVLV